MMRSFGLLRLLGARRAPSLDSGTRSRGYRRRGMTMRVMLTAEDFRALVNGDVISKQDTNASVQIALADIGWDRMMGYIAQAKQEARRGRAQGRTEEAPPAGA
jgi:hypothetical protein